MKINSYILISTALLGAINVKAVNLIGNGSFESGSFSQNSGFQDRMSLGNGSTVINNWTIGGGGNFWWLKAPSYNAEDGNFSVDLDSNGAIPSRFIQQTFPTVFGQQYQFSGYFASEANGGPASTSVFINGSSIGTVSTGSGSGNSPGLNFNNLVWTFAAFDFTASSTSTTLRLQDATEAFNGAFYNPIIDNVSVEVVPEPSISGLVGVGLLSFAALRRKLYPS